MTPGIPPTYIPRPTPPSPPAAEDALAGYVLPYISPVAERLMILAFVVYMGFTTLEAPLRYEFQNLGIVWLIYFRDVALILALLVLACQQFWRRELQATFILFAVLFTFHGIASFLLCGVPIAVIMGLKTLIPALFGAIFFPILMRKRSIGVFLLLLWLASAAGILVDYLGYSLPWKGMNESVGDYTVVVNKKWNFQGEDRIAGFARDSVLAGSLVALTGTYVLIFSRSIIWRAVIAAATLGLIYLTTSKGGAVAFALTTVACLLPMKKSQLPNKALLVFIFAVMILCPVILPNYLMPSSPAILSSFYDRVERVWPDSWANIASHSWIFGAGFGNIGVGQQFLRFDEVDTADNLFVIMYGYFGILSLVYLGLPLIAALRLKSPIDAVGRYAIITLIYIFAYGIVVNGIESAISAFMMGSAFQALALRKSAPEKEFNRGTYGQPVAKAAL